MSSKFKMVSERSLTDELELRQVDAQKTRKVLSVTNTRLLCNVGKKSYKDYGSKAATILAKLPKTFKAGGTHFFFSRHHHHHHFNHFFFFE